MIEIPESAINALIAMLARIALAALRLTPLTLVLPFLGGRNLPTQARVPMLFVLAIGAMPALLSAPPAIALTPWILIAALREITLGITLALVLAAPFFALEQGGRMLDAVRGANVAEVIAPDTGARSSPLSELLRWSFGVVFLAAGGLRAILGVIAASFDALPPDASARGSFSTGRFVEIAARWTANALGASVTLVAAGLLALVAIEVVFAVAARMSPPLAQSNLALPVRVLVPLGALAVTVGLWTGAARDFAASAVRAAGSVVGQ